MHKELGDYINRKRGGMEVSRGEEGAFSVLVPSNEVTRIGYLICCRRNEHTPSPISEAESVIAVGQILDPGILRELLYRKR
jgi:hypothetical protein